MSKSSVLPEVLSKHGFSNETHAFRYRPDTTTKVGEFDRNYSIEEISDAVIWHAAIGTLNDPFEVYAKSNRKELQQLSENEWFNLWANCFVRHTFRNTYWNALSTNELKKYFNNNIIFEKLFMIDRFENYDFFSDFIKDFRDIVAIASFTEKPDSRLMWGYYCLGMKGFCIIYNRNELINSHIRLDEVEYGKTGIEVNAMDHAYSYRTKRDDEILTKIPMFKHEEWLHECELRSLCKLDGADIGFGRPLPLKSKCVDGVIIGDKVTQATRSKLEDLSKKLNFKLFSAEANLENFIVEISEYQK
ncbi:TPA: DUF2971 domain-containing protein [Enterobacter hormaechei]|uniref:DUF2971 domain-containing protein n=1 Tax=Enterobacter cloacae complex TaxID=354276 RepID=UPI0007976C4F|nr:DUF2971 domain-containing protein [Enterobacter hormaechei]MCE1335316.1 DUF2971 domain-containing protein [Enterobacter hormaechei]MCM8075646.1 DUF2971 domain-containing protein [Enterobacter hormaechei]MCM8375576.1 DUF2971 domain-containing protein [Enterobacter hormaechei]MDF3727255.1 DUF2971 domain-containing protein [Enterobacter hormaechei]CZY49202.1 Protein of uncharacterised function (DUF2971) [Enterobacter hormaechei]